MSRIAAIGQRDRVRGFAFAGVEIFGADGPEQAREAWRALPADVALVILTAEAHAAVQDEPSWVERRALCAVMPA